MMAGVGSRTNAAVVEGAPGNRMLEGGAGVVGRTVALEFACKHCQPKMDVGKRRLRN